MNTIRAVLASLGDASLGDDSPAALIPVYAEFSCKEHFEQQLIALFAGPWQASATWLMKHHLEHVGQLRNISPARFYTAAVKPVAWQARLHVLQCVQYVPIPNARTRQLCEFLRACLPDDNKFVRAWAYAGFYHLADQHTQYRSEAGSFMRMAQRDEVASVLARIRQLQRLNARGSDRWLEV